MFTKVRWSGIQSIRRGTRSPDMLVRSSMVTGMVCTSLKWHNIVSVCIFIIIYKWGRRSRREGFSNLLHLPRANIAFTAMFLNIPEVM